MIEPKTLGEIVRTQASIEALKSDLRWSRNAAEQKTLKKDIVSLRSSLERLQIQLLKERGFYECQHVDPCQTAGCEKVANKER